MIKLEVLKTYVSYDSVPLLYSCQDTEKKLYLALSVDSEKEIELLAPVTQKQIKVLEEGVIDLRYIYRHNPKKYVLKVVTNEENKKVVKLEINLIPEKWLPEKKVKLRS